VTPGAQPQTSTVLVLARDAVIAALLGLLLELEDYEAVFPGPDERPEDAIARLRPPLIVLLDGTLDTAGSDLFHARAAARGSRVVLFSEPPAAHEVRAIARRRDIAYVSMPVDRSTLGGVLRRAATG
jgi:DNA-binding NtrC family response regulator